MCEFLQEIWDDGKLKGEQDGELKGKTKTQAMVITNMLLKNFSEDMIIEITHASSEEIEEIKNTL